MNEIYWICFPFGNDKGNAEKALKIMRKRTGYRGAIYKMSLYQLEEMDISDDEVIK